MRATIIAIVAVALVGGGYWYLYQGRPLAPASAPQNAPASYTAPQLTQEYTNNDYRFSLKLPADFTVSDLPSDAAGKTIVFQNTTGDGMQVVISPWDEPANALTEARIKQDVPDMAVSEVQPLQVGDNSNGVAFKSNNDTFGGASREVWFVYPEQGRGAPSYLYQISTYDRLDPLLKAIFQTWQFF